MVVKVNAPRSNVPDNICTPLQMEPRHAPFTSVVIEPTHVGSRTQGQDGIVREGSVAHCRNIENAGGIWLLALRIVCTNQNSRLVFRNMRWVHTVVHPFVPCLVDISTAAKWKRVTGTLGALVGKTASHGTTSQTSNRKSEDNNSNSSDAERML